MPDPTQRAYPLPKPDDDRRFTTGLLFDVVDVLVRHGYPRPNGGADLIDLQQTLFGFLYVDPPSAAPDPVCSRCLRRQSRHLADGRDPQCPDGFVAQDDPPSAPRRTGP